MKEKVFSVWQLLIIVSIVSGFVYSTTTRSVKNREIFYENRLDSLERENTLLISKLDTLTLSLIHI